MKVIARTSSNFMLVDPVSRDILEENPPRVVSWSAFFEARTGKGQIKILSSNLPNDASDDEFQKFLADAENEELAVAAYISTFGEPEPAELTDREKLEAKARELEIEFRSNISDETLIKRIAEAKAEE